MKPVEMRRSLVLHLRHRFHVSLLQTHLPNTSQSRGRGGLQSFNFHLHILLHSRELCFHLSLDPLGFLLQRVDLLSVGSLLRIPSDLGIGVLLNLGLQVIHMDFHFMLEL